MTINTFLASLPAILGLVGFVIYQLLRHNRAGDDIRKRIIDRLRVARPDTPVEYSRLTPTQLQVKLTADGELSALVSKQDFRLLQQALKQRFVESLVVYGVTGVLFLGGVAMFVRTVLTSNELALTDFHLESTAPEAHGLAVDLDTLAATWKSRGSAANLECFLENVQTLRRSEGIRTSSTEQRVLFSPDSYNRILLERERGKVNRVRVVCGDGKHSFVSQEFMLYVGIKVVVFYDPERKELLVTALIDNSSIPHYYFEAKVLIQKRGPTLDFASYGDAMSTPKTTFTIAHPEELDLRSTKIAYFGPDDSRIVRTEELVDTVSPPASQSQ